MELLLSILAWFDLTPTPQEACVCIWLLVAGPFVALAWTIWLSTNMRRIW